LILVMLFLVSVFPFSIFSGVVGSQALDLVGYWDFDQGSGTTAYDGSGYNNHGTIYGASWTSGKVNGALNFDGLDDYVDCGNSSKLDPIQEATMEAWVNFNKLPSVAGHIMAIAGKSGIARDLDLQTETDNRFKFYIGPGSPNVAISNTVAETNKWYHIAGTYQANDNVKIYVNGVLESTTSISLTRNTTSGGFWIGQSCIWPGRFFNGIIDEVKIYDRALSAEEILAEYTGFHVSILGAPSSDVMDVGQSKLFTSSVIGGTSPYSYQWYLNGTPVSGATGASWTFTPATPGSYTVYLNVNDAVGASAASNVATTTVNNAPSAIISPGSATLDVGQSQQFTSTVSGGTSPYTYQWHLNSVAVSGAASASWTFAPDSPGSYDVYVEVTDSVSFIAKSNVASVTVNPPPSVTVSPSSVVMDVGQSQQFNSSVTDGTSPYTYQWYLNDVSVSGATSSSWTFAPSSSGSYTVYVNATDKVGGIAKSNIATVTVNPPPSVIISPTSITMDLGQAKLFTSSVSGGTSPYSYQWYLNGTPVSGATSFMWAFIPSSSGSYSIYVIVTDNVNVSDTSPVSNVAVNPQLTVTISPSFAIINSSEPLTLTSVVSGGTSPYTYQWYANGALVSGATSDSWTFTPTSSDNTLYLLVIDSVGEIALSPPSNIMAPGASARPEFQPPFFLALLLVGLVVIAILLAVIVYRRRFHTRRAQ